MESDEILNFAVELASGKLKSKETYHSNWVEIERNNHSNWVDLWECKRTYVKAISCLLTPAILVTWDIFAFSDCLYASSYSVINWRNGLTYITSMIIAYDPCFLFCLRREPVIKLQLHYCTQVCFILADFHSSIQILTKTHKPYEQVCLIILVLIGSLDIEWWTDPVDVLVFVCLGQINYTQAERRQDVVHAFRYFCSILLQLALCLRVANF